MRKMQISVIGYCSCMVQPCVGVHAASPWWRQTFAYLAGCIMHSRLAGLKVDGETRTDLRLHLARRRRRVSLKRHLGKHLGIHMESCKVSLMRTSGLPLMTQYFHHSGHHGGEGDSDL
jgi:hypothetical protein